MKFSKILAASAFAGISAAQELQAEFILPLEGLVQGLNSSGWMIDVSVQYNTTATTTPIDPLSSANGYVPFQNSPGSSTSKLGAASFAPGMVVLVNSSSDPTQNFAGKFQLSGINNVTSDGEILTAFYQWLILDSSFATGPTTLTYFFVEGTAPDTISGDPAQQAGLISNVATVDFVIFDGIPSNASTGPSSELLEIVVFAPLNDSLVGVNGLGFDFDLVVAEVDPLANRLSPADGYEAFYQDSTTTPPAKSGSDPALPGLVVICNATLDKFATNPDSNFKGPQTNLAGLMQINAISSIANNTVSSVWATWLVTSTFAGTVPPGQSIPASTTIFLVNGTAPDMIPEDISTLDIISEVVFIEFAIAGNLTASTTNSTSSSNVSSSAVPSTAAVSSVATNGGSSLIPSFLGIIGAVTFGAYFF
jgi:hypothetical protein